MEEFEGKSHTGVQSQRSEEEEFEDCILDIGSLHYQFNNIPQLDFQLESTLKDTTDSVQLRKTAREKKALNLFLNNMEFLKTIFPPLFWLIHTHIFHPQEVDVINYLTNAVGAMWGQFIFPLETSVEIDSKVRDIFYHCFPYFVTQAIQQIYIQLTHSNPQVVYKSFRMDVCSTAVEIFTHIRPLKSQLQDRLGLYFLKPPPADIPERFLKKESDNLYDKTVTLPTEDLTTLIEMQHRVRPVSSSWNMAGLSSLMSAATHHRSLPFEHDAQIVVQYPQNGEADWTTQLPPLLPSSEATDPDALKFDKYNPQADPRSLLQRSRRPFLCNQIDELKKEFQQNKEKRMKEYNKLKAEIKDLNERVPFLKREILTKFSDNLRVLQLERKKNETPELPELTPEVMSDPVKFQDILKERERKKKEKEKREKEKRKKLAAITGSNPNTRPRSTIEEARMQTFPDDLHGTLSINLE